MEIPKPELKDTLLNVAITPTMDKQLRAFAARNKVSRSEAARFIIENFFKENPENIEGIHLPKNTDNFEKFGVPS